MRVYDRQEAVTNATQIPKVDVKIAIANTQIFFGDEVVVRMQILNNSNIRQKLLYNQPKIPSGGPWATTGRVTDKATQLSVVKLENKALLGSHFYTDEELEGHYLTLDPADQLSGYHKLTDIVVLQALDNKLPVGTYDLQLFYYSVPSNVLTFTVAEKDTT
ncbi:MAG: hypothetical protein LAT76_10160 [Schleiferiaceae bacterium]|nr:hypothetical protein [Schleiferiaceae bacterium]